MYRSTCLLVLLSAINCNTSGSAAQDLDVFSSDLATGSGDLAAAPIDRGGTAEDMAGAAPVRVCSADNWCWENPLPQSNTLSSLWGANANNVWAVGSYGTILKWNGTAWAAQPSGVTEDLRGFWGADANSVWAVGTRTLLKWDGKAWNAQAAGATSVLNAVWGTDANNVWAVGAQGVILKWNGTTWSPQAPGTMPSGRGDNRAMCWYMWGHVPGRRGILMTALAHGSTVFSGRAGSGPLCRGSPHFRRARSALERRRQRPMSRGFLSSSSRSFCISLGAYVCPRAARRVHWSLSNRAFYRDGRAPCATFVTA